MIDRHLKNLDAQATANKLWANHIHMLSDAGLARCFPPLHFNVSADTWAGSL